MFENLEKRVVIALICLLAILVFISVSICRESEEMVKPKFLWKVSIGQTIRGFSVSEDGDYVAVWSYEVVGKDPATSAPLAHSRVSLLDSTGAKLWTYEYPEKILFLSFSPKSSFLMAVFIVGEDCSEIHLLTGKGKLIGKFLTVGELRGVSPDENYILVDDPLDAEHLEVYDNTGNLLWKGEHFHSGRACFVSDEEFVLCDGESVALYRLSNGEKLWENRIGARIGPVSSVLSVSRTGQYVALVRGSSKDPSIYVISTQDGCVTSTYGYGKYCKYAGPVELVFLNGDRSLIVSLAPCFDRPGFLLSINNDTGAVSWEREFTKQPRVHTLPDDRRIFVRGSLCKEPKPGAGVSLESEPYNAYIFDEAGNAVWKSNIEGSVRLSADGRLLLIRQEEETLTLSDGTGLMRDLKE